MTTARVNTPDYAATIEPSKSLRVAIVAGVRFTTSEPHAGGLERHTDTLARELLASGHHVTVFAGSRHERDAVDVPYRVEPLVEQRYVGSALARSDVSMPPDLFMAEHDAYFDVLTRLDDFDVVHNNSLHYLPVATPSTVPIVHTLHTPPTPWLESAYRLRSDRSERSPDTFANSRVLSVSRANAAQWSHSVDEVVHNGVELGRWRPGMGGSPAVWSGRIVPEKGLHYALDACRRAGVDLLFAGPRHDEQYYADEIEPRLALGHGEYVGHLRLSELATLTAQAAVVVATPLWEEPFGLVAVEALACGTPVAAFDRGALAEIVSPDVGALAPGDDVAALADAIVLATSRDRHACRRRAVERFSASAMAKRYISAYAAVGAGTSEPTSHMSTAMTDPPSTR